MPQSFDFREADSLQVLPYDAAAGQLARKALQFSGPAILKKEFGITDPRLAQEKTNELADRVVVIGSDTLYALDRSADMEEVWHENALQGDEAKLALMSLQSLAAAREQGFYADRAADTLGSIQPGDTRIPLK